MLIGSSGTPLQLPGEFVPNRTYEQRWECLLRWMVTKYWIHDSGVRDVDRVQNAKVSTYGKVAATSGYPFYHQAVASLLRKEAVLLPWQRVVGACGEFKVRGDGAAEQRLRLRMEGEVSGQACRYESV